MNSDPGPAGRYFAPLAKAKYVQLTTFRRNGTPVAALLGGDDSAQAARMLARKHPVLHGWLIPWMHRRRGWTTQQYRLTPPPDAAD